MDLITTTLQELGVTAGVANPCLFVHQERSLRPTIHVDDLAVVGDKRDLEWLVQELQTSFELKYDILGTGAGETPSAEYLGRVATWTTDGLRYEANSKYVTTALQVMGMADCRPVVTPRLNVEDDAKPEPK